MGYDYFDHTEIYNFRKEFNERSSFSANGEVIGEIELDDGFFAELVKDGGITGASDRIIVLLCHREHKEKVYAFTIMAGVMICERDTAIWNVVRMKFITNYAKLKETYSRRYCSTAKKMTNKVLVKD